MTIRWKKFKFVWPVARTGYVKHAHIVSIEQQKRHLKDLDVD